jgi:Pyruvate/2-oxoacid:ferredoxin oxidoreductase gamma subunit
MNETTNVILAGVGGQGVILASELLAMAAVHVGHDTKQTEVHGIAQRGGSVHSHVRFGGRVYSPLIKPGEADVLIATEKLEGLRFAHYVREGGVIVMNSYELPPIGAGGQYPHEALDFLRGKGFRVIVGSCIPLPEHFRGNLESDLGGPAASKAFGDQSEGLCGRKTSGETGLRLGIGRKRIE